MFHKKRVLIIASLIILIISFPIIVFGQSPTTPEASKAYFCEPLCDTIIAGDINGDCKVDFKDFAIMALHWLEER